MKTVASVTFARHLSLLLAAGKTKALAQWQLLRRWSLTSPPHQFQDSSRADGNPSSHFPTEEEKTLAF